MTTNFTAGPWIQDGQYIREATPYDSAGYKMAVARVVIHRSSRPMHEWRGDAIERMTIPPAVWNANARLIACAPEMYEALEAAERDFLDLNEYWNGGNGSAVDACQHTCEVTSKALDLVRAALAKAVQP